MAQTVNDFLQVPYVDGGRDWAGLDCWGIVRLARSALFGKPLLESFGHILNKGCEAHHQAMTDVYHQLKDQYQEVLAKPGAIACCFKGGVLIHVGVVVSDGGMVKVLHTRAGNGAQLLNLRNFNRLSVDVRYFDDSDHHHVP